VAQIQRSFLLLFFKKEALAFLAYAKMDCHGRFAASH
jgi:hypothetical protein